MDSHFYVESSFLRSVLGRAIFAVSLSVSRIEFSFDSSRSTVRPYVLTIILLCCSNVFMTFAWYGHLKNMSSKPWVYAALVSWGIALFEYLMQVPANRIGNQVMSLAQLKILQEVITLTVFVPFAVFYMKEKITLDYLWAGLCLLGAAFFIFRRHFVGS